METHAIVLFIALAIFVLIFLFVVKIFPFRLWLVAYFQGAPVPLLALFRLRIQGVRLESIVHPYIKGKLAGLDLDFLQLRDLYLDGGSPEEVVEEMIKAEKEGRTLLFETAAEENIKKRSSTPSELEEEKKSM